MKVLFATNHICWNKNWWKMNMRGAKYVYTATRNFSEEVVIVKSERLNQPLIFRIYQFGSWPTNERTWSSGWKCFVARLKTSGIQFQSFWEFLQAGLGIAGEEAHLGRRVGVCPNARERRRLRRFRGGISRVGIKPIAWCFEACFYLSRDLSVYILFLGPELEMRIERGTWPLRPSFYQVANWISYMML